VESRGISRNSLMMKIIFNMLRQNIEKQGKTVLLYKTLEALCNGRIVNTLKYTFTVKEKMTMYS